METILRRRRNFWSKNGISNGKMGTLLRRRRKKMSSKFGPPPDPAMKKELVAFGFFSKKANSPLEKLIPIVNLGNYVNSPGGFPKP